jgi:hypothetical protein
VPNRKRDTSTVDLPVLARATAREEAPASVPAPVSVDIPLASVPQVLVTAGQLLTLPFDPRRAFLLSLIDGTLTVDEILDASALERDEAIEMLAGFIQDGIIVLRRGPADRY